MSDNLSSGIVPPTINLAGLVLESERTTNRSLYDILTLPFTVPSVGSTVTVGVNNSSRFKEGMRIYINSIGIFKVEAISSPTSMIISNETGVLDTVVATGTVFNTCSPEYIDTDTKEMYFTNVDAEVIPAVGDNFDMTVPDSSRLAVGVSFFVQDVMSSFRVTALPTDTSITVINIDCIPGVTMSSGAVCYTAAPTDNDAVVLENVSIPASGNKIVTEIGSVSIDAGTDTISGGYAAVGGIATQNFNSAFVADPNIQITIRIEAALTGDSLGEIAFFPDFSGVATGAGFDIYCDNAGSDITDGTIYFDWVAIGQKEI